MAASFDWGNDMYRYRLRTPSIVPIIAVLLLLPVIATGLYVAGYLLLSTAHDYDVNGQPIRSRGFAREWQCDVFEPAASVESILSGRDVRLGADETKPFGEDVVPEVG